VDEPTQQVPPANISRADRHRIRGFGLWGREGERAMGSPAVVVIGIRPERPIEMPPTEDKRPVEASALIVSIKRSAYALAFGARIGVRITLAPPERTTSSKALLNFVSRTWMRNRMAVERSSRSVARFLACWVTQAESGRPWRRSGGSFGSRAR
jgi:hypothetical protein